MWRMNTHDVRKHMTHENKWCTKTHNARKHMTYKNTWRTKTHVVQKHMTHENTCRTKTHHARKHMTHKNTWRTKTRLKPAISGFFFIRFHPVYRPYFYFIRKQMTPFYLQLKLPDNREYIKKYDQWPHDSYVTGRAGVWEADDIVQFYIALLDFFNSYFINEVNYKKYGSGFQH
jgi:hypothetical protein